MVSLEFFIVIILPAALWPWGWLGLYQKCLLRIFLGDKGGQCVWLTTLPPSCADCHKIWVPQPHGNLRACPGLYRNCFTSLLGLVSYMNPALKIHFNIILQFLLMCVTWFHALRSEVLYAFCISFVCYMLCFSLNLVALLFGEKETIWHSVFVAFLFCFFFLNPNILLCTLFSDVSQLFVSRKMRDKAPINEKVKCFEQNDHKQSTSDTCS
jgi:hypothetical protein